MSDLDAVAPDFVAMAHAIVWATVATVGPSGRPRSRILHPLWDWNGIVLRGWIATVPTPLKLAHLEAHPFVSVGYWSPNHDNCTAECGATWAYDDETCVEVWDRFVNAPAPVGYDPRIVPDWADGPTSDSFAVLRLAPSRLRVFPGSVLLGTGGEVRTWRQR